MSACSPSRVPVFPGKKSLDGVGQLVCSAVVTLVCVASVVDVRRLEPDASRSIF